MIGKEGSFPNNPSGSQQQSGWINGDVCFFDGLLRTGKEQTIARCNNVGGSDRELQWRQQTQAYTRCDFIYMKFKNREKKPVLIAVRREVTSGGVGVLTGRGLSGVWEMLCALTLLLLTWMDT